MRDLMALDMNVIVTARAKPEYDSSGGEMMKVVGETFDGEKTLAYWFDTVIDTYIEGLPEG